MAVYTQVDEEALARFLEAYGIGPPLSFKGVAEGVENSNYMLDTEQGRFFLTLYEKRVKKKDLPFFLGLMEHLAAKGLPCPVPIKRKDGGAISTLAGRPAALISFLDGMSVTRPEAAHCRQVGVALGDLHRLAAGFELKRENAMGLKGWRTLADEIGARADTVSAGLTSILAKELEFLGIHWPRDLPKGVIHADLFPDNVFFLKDRLCGLIDFYFACNDLLALDLAIALNAWCFERKGEFNVTKARALIAGYRDKRALTPEELSALPVIARGAALRFLLTRTIDWIDRPQGALVRAKDPGEYLKKLRFHQRAKTVGDYGLDV